VHLFYLAPLVFAVAGVEEVIAREPTWARAAEEVIVALVTPRALKAATKESSERRRITMSGSDLSR
jgi:hypothetical protein